MAAIRDMGLNPDGDRIIELALVVTNANLDIVAEAPVWVVHQPDAVLDGMDEWNRNTHGKSGLTARVRSSILTEAEVEAGKGRARQDRKVVAARSHSAM